MSAFLITMGIIFMIAGIALLIGRFCSNSGKGLLMGSLIAGILGVALFIMGISVTVIETGEVGIKYDMGRLVESDTLNPGIHWHTPFTQSIRKINTMQQNANEASDKEAKIWGESKDKLPIYCRDVRITYQINPHGLLYLLKNVTDIDELSNWGKTIQSAFAAATINFDDVDVAKQSLIEPTMLEELQRLTDEKYGKTDGISNVAVIRVLIGELDYEEAYQEAITEKKNADQQAQKQAIENQMNIDKATAEAEAKNIKSDAEAYKIKIEAEAQADANELINKTLTSDILKKMEMEARLKHGWIEITGADAIIANTKD